MSPTGRWFAAARALLPAGAMLLTAAGCETFRRPAPPEEGGPAFTLAALPFEEYWSGVTLAGIPVGYVHFRLRPAEGGFLVETGTELRFRMLGTDKQTTYLTRDWVDERLRLTRFAHEYAMDDSRLAVEGRVAGGKLYTTLTNAAGTRHDTLPLDAPVYPAAAQLLYPLLAGIREGARYRYQVYDAESQRLNRVEQEVTGYERVRGVPAWRIETLTNRNLFLAWLDARGLPLREQAANGSIEAETVSRAQALDYLDEAAHSRSETLLHYSLVRTRQHIDDPRRLRRMVVELAGLGDFPLPADNGRQHCRRPRPGVHLCTIDTQRRDPRPPVAAAIGDTLAASPAVPAGHARIRRLAERIAGDADATAERITALVGWMREHIQGEAIDSFNALDVLEQGRGECQGQSFLYAALARTMGIPTRVVNGLVYAPEHRGFLYHTWVESWDGKGWQSVDPIFGQTQADATHLALVYGETLADFAPLMSLMGQLRASILEADPG